MAAPPPQPGHLTGSAASSTEATFAVAGEDHTLGNALVGALNAQPQVAFAGYTVPHPADDVVHVRVQTTPEGGRTAAEALKVAAGGACRPVGSVASAVACVLTLARSSCADVVAQCDVIQATFDAALQAFRSGEAAR